MAKTEKDKQKELKALHEEVIAKILKRSGVSKKLLYEDAISRFINANLELLTPAEIEKYKGKVLLL
ncbi:MAG: hypothetical protein CSA89_01270 [Bacteroidales bacterium]|nr:MAG: hypothetical protein CSA89_01270 [Bacteroidales bacterium]